MLASCATATAHDPMGELPQRPDIAARIGTPIQHVVIVVQENRSFDNIFAGFPGADAPTVGKLPNGKTIPLHTIEVNTLDPEHSFQQSLADVDGGKMDGFANGAIYGGGSNGNPPLQLSRLDPTLVAPYWSMAEQYTLADHMFPTEHGPSWTAHLNLIAGTTTITPTKAVINFPTNFFGAYCGAPKYNTTHTVDVSGTYGIGPYPCFTQFHTLADSLDTANVRWRYYAPTTSGGTCITACGGQWSPFASIKAIRYSRYWKKNVISPPPQVLKDIAAGKLAAVTWIVPESPWSDHAYAGALPEGPSWVAAIVNAIGESAFWKSTAIVVLWDEWGGFYDDVPPPQLDFRGLGIRVPCIIISPYAIHGHVSHTQYEYGSILRFIEEVFHLKPIGPRSQGYTDRRATSIIDSFDFTQQPSAFTPISAPYPPSTFIDAPESRLPPDEE
jgi:phospholipase C